MDKRGVRGGGSGSKECQGVHQCFRRLAREINLRNTPEITFIMDQSIEYGVNMSRRIDEIVAQDDENARMRDDDERDGEGTEGAGAIEEEEGEDGFEA